MSRSYRLPILALGLILASTGHADAKSSSEQAAAQKSISQHLKNIAQTNDKQVERVSSPDKKDEPCEQGENNRYSDLCAQWKAADAAADSAWWAWASGMIGFVSLIGVFGALGLAFHSNWIARDTAQRQLRAYVGVFSARGENFGPNSRPKFVIEIRNTGQTPAIELKVSSEFFLLPAEEGRPNETPDLTGHSSQILGAGQPAPCHILCDRSLSDLEWAQLNSGEIQAYFTIYGEYKDIFGKIHHFGLHGYPNNKSENQNIKTVEGTVIFN